jgi:exodeoxyribonuclease-3
MRFFDALQKHLANIKNYDERIFIGGDFNVAPENIDVFDPIKIANTICFHPQEQEKFRALVNTGFADIYRELNPHAKQFTWWDYRAGAYQNNHGLRIDFILTNPLASDSVSRSYVHTAIRDAEKTSDHAPVIVEIE